MPYYTRGSPTRRAELRHHQQHSAPQTTTSSLGSTRSPTGIGMGRQSSVGQHPRGGSVVARFDVTDAPHSLRDHFKALRGDDVDAVNTDPPAGRPHNEPPSSVGGMSIGRGGSMNTLSFPGETPLQTNPHATEGTGSSTTLVCPSSYSTTTTPSASAASKRSNRTSSSNTPQDSNHRSPSNGGGSVGTPLPMHASSSSRESGVLQSPGGVDLCMVPSEDTIAGVLSSNSAGSSMNGGITLGGMGGGGGRGNGVSLVTIHPLTHNQQHSPLQHSSGGGGIGSNNTFSNFASATGSSNNTTRAVSFPSEDPNANSGSFHAHTTFVDSTSDLMSANPAPVPRRNSSSIFTNAGTSTTFVPQGAGKSSSSQDELPRTGSHLYPPTFGNLPYFTSPPTSSSVAPVSSILSSSNNISAPTLSSNTTLTSAAAAQYALSVSQSTSAYHPNATPATARLSSISVSPQSISVQGYGSVSAVSSSVGGSAPASSSSFSNMNTPPPVLLATPSPSSMSAANIPKADNTSRAARTKEELCESIAGFLTVLSRNATTPESAQSLQMLRESIQQMSPPRAVPPSSVVSSTPHIRPTALGGSSVAPSERDTPPTHYDPTSLTSPRSASGQHLPASLTLPSTPSSAAVATIATGLSLRDILNTPSRPPFSAAKSAATSEPPRREMVRAPPAIREHPDAVPTNHGDLSASFPFSHLDTTTSPIVHPPPPSVPTSHATTGSMLEESASGNASSTEIPLARRSSSGSQQRQQQLWVPTAPTDAGGNFSFQLTGSLPRIPSQTHTSRGDDMSTVSLHRSSSLCEEEDERGPTPTPTTQQAQHSRKHSDSLGSTGGRANGGREHDTFSSSSAVGGGGGRVTPTRPALSGSQVSALPDTRTGSRDGSSNHLTTGQAPTTGNSQNSSPHDCTISSSQACKSVTTVHGDESCPTESTTSASGSTRATLQAARGGGIRSIVTSSTSSGQQLSNMYLLAQQVNPATGTTWSGSVMNHSLSSNAASEGSTDHHAPRGLPKLKVATNPLSPPTDRTPHKSSPLNPSWDTPLSYAASAESPPPHALPPQQQVQGKRLIHSPRKHTHHHHTNKPPLPSSGSPILQTANTSFPSGTSHPSPLPPAAVAPPSSFSGGIIEVQTTDNSSMSMSLQNDLGTFSTSPGFQTVNSNNSSNVHSSSISSHPPSGSRGRASVESIQNTAAFIAGPAMGSQVEQQQNNNNNTTRSSNNSDPQQRRSSGSGSGSYSAGAVPAATESDSNHSVSVNPALPHLPNSSSSTSNIIQVSSPPLSSPRPHGNNTETTSSSNNTTANNYHHHNTTTSSSTNNAHTSTANNARSNSGIVGVETPLPFGPRSSGGEPRHVEEFGDFIESVQLGSNVHPSSSARSGNSWGESFGGQAHNSALSTPRTNSLTRGRHRSRGGASEGRKTGTGGSSPPTTSSSSGPSSSVTGNNVLPSGAEEHQVHYADLWYPLAGNSSSPTPSLRQEYSLATQESTDYGGGAGSRGVGGGGASSNTTTSNFNNNNNVGNLTSSEANTSVGGVRLFTPASNHVPSFSTVASPQLFSPINNNNDSQNSHAAEEGISAGESVDAHHAFPPSHLTLTTASHGQLTEAPAAARLKQVGESLWKKKNKRIEHAFNSPLSHPSGSPNSQAAASNDNDDSSSEGTATLRHVGVDFTMNMPPGSVNSVHAMGNSHLASKTTLAYDSFADSTAAAVALGSRVPNLPIYGAGVSTSSAFFASQSAVGGSPRTVGVTTPSGSSCSVIGINSPKSATTAGGAAYSSITARPLRQDNPTIGPFNQSPSLSSSSRTTSGGMGGSSRDSSNKQNSPSTMAIGGYSSITGRPYTTTTQQPQVPTVSAAMMFSSAIAAAASYPRGIDSSDGGSSPASLTPSRRVSQEVSQDMRGSWQIISGSVSNTSNLTAQPMSMFPLARRISDSSGGGLPGHAPMDDLSKSTTSTTASALHSTKPYLSSSRLLSSPTSRLANNNSNNNGGVGGASSSSNSPGAVGGFGASNSAPILLSPGPALSTTPPNVPPAASTSSSSHNNSPTPPVGGAYQGPFQESGGGVQGQSQSGMWISPSTSQSGANLSSFNTAGHSTKVSPVPPPLSLQQAHTHSTNTAGLALCPSPHIGGGGGAFPSSTSSVQQSAERSPAVSATVADEAGRGLRTLSEEMQDLPKVAIGGAKPATSTLLSYTPLLEASGGDVNAFTSLGGTIIRQVNSPSVYSQDAGSSGSAPTSTPKVQSPTKQLPYSLPPPLPATYAEFPDSRKRTTPPLAPTRPPPKFGLEAGLPPPMPISATATTTTVVPPAAHHDHQHGYPQSPPRSRGSSLGTPRGAAATSIGRNLGISLLEDGDAHHMSLPVVAMSSGEVVMVTAGGDNNSPHPRDLGATSPKVGASFRGLPAAGGWFDSISSQPHRKGSGADSSGGTSSGVITFDNGVVQVLMGQHTQHGPQARQSLHEELSPALSPPLPPPTNASAPSTPASSPPQQPRGGGGNASPQLVKNFSFGSSLGHQIPLAESMSSSTVTSVASPSYSVLFHNNPGGSNSAQTHGIFSSSPSAAGGGTQATPGSFSATHSSSYNESRSMPSTALGASSGGAASSPGNPVGMMHGGLLELRSDSPADVLDTPLSDRDHLRRNPPSGKPPVPSITSTGPAGSGSTSSGNVAAGESSSSTSSARVVAHTANDSVGTSVGRHVLNPAEATDSPMSHPAPSTILASTNGSSYGTHLHINNSSGATAQQQQQGHLLSGGVSAGVYSGSTSSLQTSFAAPHNNSHGTLTTLFSFTTNSLRHEETSTSDQSILGGGTSLTRRSQTTTTTTSNAASNKGGGNNHGLLSPSNLVAAGSTSQNIPPSRKSSSGYASSTENTQASVSFFPFQGATQPSWVSTNAIDLSGPPNSRGSFVLWRSVSAGGSSNSPFVPGVASSPLHIPSSPTSPTRVAPEAAVLRTANDPPPQPANEQQPVSPDSTAARKSKSSRKLRRRNSESMASRMEDSPPTDDTTASGISTTTTVREGGGGTVASLTSTPASATPQTSSPRGPPTTAGLARQEQQLMPISEDKNSGGGAAALSRSNSRTATPPYSSTGDELLSSLAHPTSALVGFVSSPLFPAEAAAHNLNDQTNDSICISDATVEAIGNSAALRGRSDSGVSTGSTPNVGTRKASVTSSSSDRSVVTPLMTSIKGAREGSRLNLGMLGDPISWHPTQHRVHRTVVPPAPQYPVLSSSAAAIPRYPTHSRDQLHPEIILSDNDALEQQPVSQRGLPTRLGGDDDDDSEPASPRDSTLSTPKLFRKSSAATAATDSPFAPSVAQPRSALERSLGGGASISDLVRVTDRQDIATDDFGSEGRRFPFTYRWREDSSSRNASFPNASTAQVAPTAPSDPVNPAANTTPQEVTASGDTLAPQTHGMKRSTSGGGVQGGASSTEFVPIGLAMCVELGTSTASTAAPNAVSTSFDGVAASGAGQWACDANETRLLHPNQEVGSDNNNNCGASMTSGTNSVDERSTTKPPSGLSRAGGGEGPPYHMDTSRNSGTRDAMNMSNSNLRDDVRGSSATEVPKNLSALSELFGSRTINGNGSTSSTTGNGGSLSTKEVSETTETVSAPTARATPHLAAASTSGRPDSPNLGNVSTLAGSTTRPPTIPRRRLSSISAAPASPLSPLSHAREQEVVLDLLRRLLHTGGASMGGRVARGAEGEEGIFLPAASLIDLLNMLTETPPTSITTPRGYLASGHTISASSTPNAGNSTSKSPPLAPRQSSSISPSSSTTQTPPTLLTPSANNHTTPPLQISVLRGQRFPVADPDAPPLNASPTSVSQHRLSSSAVSGASFNSRAGSVVIEGALAGGSPTYEQVGVASRIDWASWLQSATPNALGLPADFTDSVVVFEGSDSSGAPVVGIAPRGSIAGHQLDSSPSTTLGVGSIDEELLAAGRNPPLFNFPTPEGHSPTSSPSATAMSQTSQKQDGQPHRDNPKNPNTLIIGPSLADAAIPSSGRVGGSHALSLSSLPRPSLSMDFDVNQFTVTTTPVGADSTSAIQPLTTFVALGQSSNSGVEGTSSRSLSSRQPAAAAVGHAALIPSSSEGFSGHPKGSPNSPSLRGHDGSAATERPPSLTTQHPLSPVYFRLRSQGFSTNGAYEQLFLDRLDTSRGLTLFAPAPLPPPNALPTVTRGAPSPPPPATMPTFHDDGSSTADHVPTAMLETTENTPSFDSNSNRTSGANASLTSNRLVASPAHLPSALPIEPENPLQLPPGLLGDNIMHSLVNPSPNHQDGCGIPSPVSTGIPGVDSVTVHPWQSAAQSQLGDEGDHGAGGVNAYSNESYSIQQQPLTEMDSPTEHATASAMYLSRAQSSVILAESSSGRSSPTTTVTSTNNVSRLVLPSSLQHHGSPSAASSRTRRMQQSATASPQSATIPLRRGVSFGGGQFKIPDHSSSSGGQHHRSSSISFSDGSAAGQQVAYTSTPRHRALFPLGRTNSSFNVLGGGGYTAHHNDDHITPPARRNSEAFVASGQLIRDVHGDLFFLEAPEQQTQEFSDARGNDVVSSPTYNPHGLSGFPNFISRSPSAVFAHSSPPQAAIEFRQGEDRRLGSAAPGGAHSARRQSSDVHFGDSIASMIMSGGSFFAADRRLSQSKSFMDGQFPIIVTTAGAKDGEVDGLGSPSSQHNAGSFPAFRGAAGGYLAFHPPQYLETAPLPSGPTSAPFGSGIGNNSNNNSAVVSTTSSRVERIQSFSLTGTPGDGNMVIGRKSRSPGVRTDGASPTNEPLVDANPTNVRSPRGSHGGGSASPLPASPTKRRGTDGIPRNASSATLLMCGDYPLSPSSSRRPRTASNGPAADGAQSPFGGSGFGAFEAMPPMFMRAGSFAGGASYAATSRTSSIGGDGASAIQASSMRRNQSFAGGQFPVNNPSNRHASRSASAASISDMGGYRAYHVATFLEPESHPSGSPWLEGNSLPLPSHTNVRANAMTMVLVDRAETKEYAGQEEDADSGMPRWQRLQHHPLSPGSPTHSVFASRTASFSAIENERSGSFAWTGGGSPQYQHQNNSPMFVVRREPSWRMVTRNSQSLSSSRPASFRFTGSSPKSLRRGQSFGGGQFPVPDDNDGDSAAAAQKTWSPTRHRGGYEAAHAIQPLAVPPHLLGRSSPLDLGGPTNMSQPAPEGAKENRPQPLAEEKKVPLTETNEPTSDTDGPGGKQPPGKTAANMSEVRTTTTTTTTTSGTLNVSNTTTDNDVPPPFGSSSGSGEENSPGRNQRLGRPHIGVVYMAPPPAQQSMLGAAGQPSDDCVLSATTPDSCDATGSPFSAAETPGRHRSPSLGGNTTTEAPPDASLIDVPSQLPPPQWRS